MKKNLLSAAIITLAFITGYSVNNLAFSFPGANYKIAVVDIQKIVANSSEIKTLKDEHQKQIKQIQDTAAKARAEISSEKDTAKIAQLEEKYRNEINNAKLALDNSYNNNLIAADLKIKNAVIEKARSMHYNLILPKHIVLYGGDDITEQVSSIIK